MERSIDEHAADSSQPCRKGKITDRMSALEAAYEEYRYNIWPGVYNQLPDIRKPVLVVTGNEDVSTPAQNANILASRIKGSKLVVFPGAGHGLNYMYPIGFANVVLDYLK